MNFVLKTRAKKNGKSYYKWVPSRDLQAWRGVKEWVYLRDGEKCVYCGSRKDITIDHVVPLRWGGTDDISNLQVLCKRCNKQKGSSHFLELPCGVLRVC